jgi:hypothetical protein
VTTGSGPNEEFARQPGDEGLALPPWEERERYGLLNALYLTIKDVLLSPDRFFARMPSRIGIAQPLLFAMVVGVISAFFLWMWSLTASSLQIFFVRDLHDWVRAPLVMGLGFVFSPIIVVVNVLIFSGLSHLCLVVLGGDRFGFEATFRAVAYAAAVSVLAVVPFCGIVVVPLWTLGVIVVGLTKVHETELWKAIVAVILPLLATMLGCGGFPFFLSADGIF